MRSRKIIVSGIFIGLIILLLWCASSFIKYAIPIHRSHFSSYDSYCKYSEPGFTLLRFPENASDIMYYAGFYRARKLCGVSFSIPAVDYSEYKEQLSGYLELCGNDIYTKDEMEDITLNSNWFRSHGMANVERVIKDDESIEEYGIVNCYNNPGIGIVMILANDNSNRFIIIEYDEWSNDDSEQIINP